MNIQLILIAAFTLCVSLMASFVLPSPHGYIVTAVMCAQLLCLQFPLIIMPKRFANINLKSRLVVNSMFSLAFAMGCLLTFGGKKWLAPSSLLLVSLVSMIMVRTATTSIEIPPAAQLLNVVGYVSAALGAATLALALPYWTFGHAPSKVLTTMRVFSGFQFGFGVWLIMKQMLPSKSRKGMYWTDIAFFGIMVAITLSVIWLPMANINAPFAISSYFMASTALGISVYMDHTAYRLFNKKKPKGTNAATATTTETAEPTVTAPETSNVHSEAPDAPTGAGAIDLSSDDSPQAPPVQRESRRPHKSRANGKHKSKSISSAEEHFET